MQARSKIITLFISFITSMIFIFVIHACSPKHELENTILLGTIAGPETELAEVAKHIAKEKYDLDIHIIPFNDYVEPNRALSKGEINANMFQHQPYLDDLIERYNLKLTSIAKLFIYPLGIYSDKYKTINEIKNNAVVAIPNDPSNKTRSLLLLEKAGLIRLNPYANNQTISLKDISENPKNLDLKEVDPVYMVRMLSKVDLAVINTNYAAMGRLFPNRDALFTESNNSQYANIIVTREQDQNKEKFQRLIKAFQSPEVVSRAKHLFNGSVMKAW